MKRHSFCIPLCFALVCALCVFLLGTAGALAQSFPSAQRAETTTSLAKAGDGEPLPFSVEVGDYILSSATELQEDRDYSSDGATLSIMSNTPITIQNKDMSRASSQQIYCDITNDVTGVINEEGMPIGSIILNGVAIETTSGPCIRGSEGIADGFGLELILADGSQNSLRQSEVSAAGEAAISWSTMMYINGGQVLAGGLGDLVLKGQDKGTGQLACYSASQACIGGKTDSNQARNIAIPALGGIEEISGTFNVYIEGGSYEFSGAMGVVGSSGALRNIHISNTCINASAERENMPVIGYSGAANQCANNTVEANATIVAYARSASEVIENFALNGGLLISRVQGGSWQSELFGNDIHHMMSSIEIPCNVEIPYKGKVYIDQYSEVSFAGSAHFIVENGAEVLTAVSFDTQTDAIINPEPRFVMYLSAGIDDDATVETYSDLPYPASSDKTTAIQAWYFTPQVDDAQLVTSETLVRPNAHVLYGSTEQPTPPAPEPPTPGWHQDEVGWRYADAEGNYYADGWHEIDGVRYYFQDTGYVFANGWLVLDGARYYILPTASPVSAGWHELEGNWYHFDELGAAQTGWIWDTLYAAWFFCNDDGVMQTGWLWNDSQNGWSYCNPINGAALVNGWNLIDGVWYFFNENGVRVQGWIWDTFYNAWFFCNDDGVMQTGWLWNEEHDEWFYCSPSNGAARTNCWADIEGIWYFFNKSGAMARGWLWDVSYINWYYCDVQTGHMLQSVWHFIDGEWYGFNANGSMSRGWTWDANYRNWFYCDETNGHMMHDGWQQIRGTWYHFGSDGQMSYGWVWDPAYNAWFYCDWNYGQMYQGWHWIGSSCYFFYDNGTMAQNTTVHGYRVDESGRWIQ